MFENRQDYGQFFENQYIKAQVVNVYTGVNEPIYNHKLLQFWTFYCTQNEQDLTLRMEVNPTGAPKATLRDYPTYCTTVEGDKQECEIVTKGCQEGDVIGTLGLVTEGGNTIGVGPTVDNQVADTIDGNEEDKTLIYELFDRQLYYYNNPAEFISKTTTGEAKIQIATQPMTMNDMSVFKVEGYNSFVYFTFICHESKKDYKFILKNSNLLDKISTYQDYETEC